VQKEVEPTNLKYSDKSDGALDPSGLKNKLALVSGASRGIGRAIALRLGHLGANLIIISRNSTPLNAVKEEVESLGVKCWAFTCDPSDASQLTSLLDSAVANLGVGMVDILVNNAGLFMSEPVRGHRATSWEKTLAVNLNAAFHLSRLLVGH